VKLTALVLAAGASSRMGRPKPLLPLPDGSTLLCAATRPFLEAGLDEVIVVLGALAAQVRAEACLPHDPRLTVIDNPGWAEGQASSLRAGLAACGEPDAVLIFLGDLNGLDAARVRRVIAAWHGEPLVVPQAAGRPTHPVLMARELFGELLALRGDVGAREVVERHRSSAVLLEEPPLFDLDTPEDHRAWLADPARARR
jgi:CTP:molybdopterin cytidylyltransferase MocA